MEPLSPTYDHSNYEKKWWDFWEDGGWFHAEVDPKRTPYTILAPPPNVTDKLHMGHGLNSSLQDILVRWKRMNGYNACWLPGTDHAGIATQMMVEKSLVTQGTTRQELGREAFIDKCKEWKDDNGGMITRQLRRLGCSCDWPREAYTMDKGPSDAVRRIFVELFDQGLIYRRERLVNWDSVLKTAVSDDEVNNEEQASSLWRILYPLEGVRDQYVEVATTRPETLFGDTAVAVHPDDERYKHLIGKKVVVPFVERSIEIVADTHVKMEFGSGCLKITPAHDKNDFEIGQRHGLECINILAEDGSLNEICPQPFAGVDRFAARKLVVKHLKERELLAGIDPIKHVVPISDRSKSPIEPRLSKQWYVKMEKLAAPAIQAARNDELHFYPDTWKKTYFHWLENIQDWCISRQLWWGHRIPIWHCLDCEEVTSGVDDPTVCRGCSSTRLEQDPDVLDTWFSSWLWPLSPFGWPEETKDLNYFFPSQVLITGAEIIFLWVARMIMVSHFTKGKLPFRDVYFNAIICDQKGRKFSKTLGNGIDPLELIDRYGADAVRFTTISLAPLGGRVKMSVDDFENGNRFINKLWNASRFLFNKLEENALLSGQMPDFDEARLGLPDKWLLTRLGQVAGNIDRYLDTYQMNAAVDEIYHFIWGSFCDWGLEVSKEALTHADVKNRQETLSVLVYVFEGLLRLASPFIPFVTEELWHRLPAHPRWSRSPSLVIATYPQGESIPQFADAARTWEVVQQVISGVRSVRTQAKVPPKELLDVAINCDDQILRVALEECSQWLKKLAGMAQVSISTETVQLLQCLTATGKGWSAQVNVGRFLDTEKELKRLRAESGRIEKIVNGLERKLANNKFVANAPKEVIKSTREQQDNMRQQFAVVQENIKSLSGNK